MPRPVASILSLPPRHKNSFPSAAWPARSTRSILLAPLLTTDANRLRLSLAQTVPPLHAGVSVHWMVGLARVASMTEKPVGPS